MRNQSISLSDKKFIRFKEGAAIYGMSQSQFQALAQEANACYKVGKTLLVNIKRMDRFLERYRIFT